MSIYEIKGSPKMKKPSDKRAVKNKKVAFGKTEKSVKPVALDTNKTRRKMVKPTKSATIAKGKM